MVELVESTAAMPGIGDDSMGGMGIDVADIDLDGDWDLYITDVEIGTIDSPPLGNVLYLGDSVAGLADNSAPESGVVSAFSWGANFFDVDHDGWEDLFVATFSKELYRNDGVDPEGLVSFTEVPMGAGQTEGKARGSAVADFDRDGDLDLAVINEDGPLQLFRNDTVSAGRWLILELDAAASNRDAIGTVVEVTVGPVVHRRQVKGGSSAHSQDALIVHFGVGDAESIDRILVRWPSGAESELLNVAPDRYLTVREPLVQIDGFESGGASFLVVGAASASCRARDLGSGVGRFAGSRAWTACSGTGW